MREKHAERLPGRHAFAASQIIHGKSPVPQTTLDGEFVEGSGVLIVSVDIHCHIFTGARLFRFYIFSADECFISLSPAAICK